MTPGPEPKPPFPVHSVHQNLGWRLHACGGPLGTKSWCPSRDRYARDFAFSWYPPNAHRSGIPQTKSARFWRTGSSASHRCLQRSVWAWCPRPRVLRGREVPSVQVRAGIASVLGCRRAKHAMARSPGPAAALASDFNALSRRSGPDSRADGSRRYCIFSNPPQANRVRAGCSTRRRARRRRGPDSGVVPSGRTWRPVIGFAEVDPTRRSRVPEKRSRPIPRSMRSPTPRPPAFFPVG